MEWPKPSIVYMVLGQSPRKSSTPPCHPSEPSETICKVCYSRPHSKWPRRPHSKWRKCHSTPRRLAIYKAQCRYTLEHACCFGSFALIKANILGRKLHHKNTKHHIVYTTYRTGINAINRCQHPHSIIVEREFRRKTSCVPLPPRSVKNTNRPLLESLATATISHFDLHRVNYEYD